MTEIENRKDTNNWKTTKEVAGGLGVSPNTLHRFRSDNKQLFEGLVASSSGEEEKNDKSPLLWSPKAIKILMFNISNPQVDQWKKDVINEFTEKGMVVSSPKVLIKPESKLELIKIQSQQIQMQSQQIIMVIDELQQMKNGIREQQEKALSMENKMEFIDSGLKTFEQKYENEKLITPQTKKKITDMVHLCVINSGKHYNKFYSRIWDKFNIRSTNGISEKLGQKIVDWMQNNTFFQYFIKKKENKEV